MMWQRLNHPLTDETPQYGSNPPVHAELASSIKSGAASNTHIIRLHNHSGTHIDAPRHFRDDGLTVADFPDDFWVFEKIYLLDLLKEPDMLISAEDVERHSDSIEACELILIRTGHERYRSLDPNRYRLHNPGIAPEAAHLIRSYKHLRAVGIDTISVTPYQNRVLGRETHRAFFDAQYSDEFILIEDLHLEDIGPPDVVIIEPVFRMAIDATPVIAMATYKSIEGVTDGAVYM